MSAGTPEEEDPQTRAMRRAGTLWADDAFARGLGIVIVEVGPGRAILELTVEPAMANGHGTAHGGVLFSLADSAFAFAANSGADEHEARHATVAFLRAVAVGERLRAEATRRHLGSDGGLFDVTVTDETGEVVAEFRGHSRLRPAAGT